MTSTRDDARWVWSSVIEERRALVELLDGVEPDRWEVESPCPGWTVHDVVAHLVHTALTTRLGFVAGLARARFDFDHQNARGVEQQRGQTPGETLERLRAVVGRTTGPPAPLDTRLVEAVVHGEDIRRPLGVSHDYGSAVVERALRLQLRTPGSFGGGREIASGLTLRAVDADVSVGDGPDVRGTLLDLLLVVSGRGAAPGGLSGPGATELRSRVAAG